MAFTERTDGEGNPSENPSEYLGLELPDGVVLESLFVERTQPESLHVQETMDEDDSFLSRAGEIWEYDVAPGREKDFVDAVRNSRMVMDLEELGED